jgi:GT2 family glycosyltransferase
MTDNLRVAVVTAVHNRRELTLQCLKSLSRINSDGLDVSVIVVDDGSTDGTSEAIAREFPDVKVVPGSGDLWFTEGTNVGVRAALLNDPKYVLMMNDDQVFDAEFLRSMVETAEAHPRSVVGALLLLWDQPHKVFQTAPVWNTWLGGWQHWFQQTVWTVPEIPFEVDLIVGNCVLVPAEAITECGLMNSRRYPNFGDAEYTPRLKRAGWKLLIDPRARVFCQPNTVPASARKKSFRQMFNVLFVDLKNVNSLRRRWYAYMDTAPSKPSGAAAFCIFIVRAFFRVNPESPAFSERNPEIPLRKRLGNSIVKG